MRSAESWQPIVEALGYPDEKAMLEDLYVAQGMSIAELASRLGFSRGIVIQHLTTQNIKLRGRGGPNRKVTSRLSEIKDEEFVNVHALAEKLGMHYSTVYKEARRRGLCISVLSLQQAHLTDTEDAPPTSSALPSSAMEPTREVELTLSGILQELEPETPSSSTMEPTRLQSSTPKSI